MSDEMHTGHEWSELLKDAVLDADGWRGKEFYELEIIIRFNGICTIYNFFE